MRKVAIIVAVWCMMIIAGCVTKTINSDGTQQSNTVDEKKLSNTYVDIAIEYQKHNAPQIALERVNLALKANSDNSRAYMVRGMIYQQLAKNQAAEANFKKALRLDDAYAEAYVNYGAFLCAQKRYAEALKNYDLALANPLYFTPELAYYNRGLCYYQQNNYNAANQDLLKSLTFHNPPQDSYVSLAQIQFAQKNYQLANYYLNKYSASQTPQTMWLHIQILQMLINQERDSRRIKEYTNYRNILGKLLVNNYGDTVEAQQYVLKYGNSSALVKPQTSNMSNLIAESEPRPVNSSTSVVSSRIKYDSFARRYIVVANGETAYSLSRKFAISVTQLKQINHLTNGLVKTGMRIYLDPH